jgi:hypothetical protein
MLRMEWLGSGAKRRCGQSPKLALGVVVVSLAGAAADLLGGGGRVCHEVLLFI